jgi:lipopolysaccharide export system protein LptA
MRRIRPVATLSLIALSLACLPAMGQQQSGVESRLTGLRLNGNEPIEIESDKLEVQEAENKAIFTGNVSVTQGPTVLRSGTMTVFYAKDGGSAATGSSNIERLEVDGKVYVKSDRQVATGDSGVFDMKTEVLTLSGKEVVLSEGNNVLRGCKLTVQMKSGRAQVDGCGKAGSGRVQMKLDPSSRQ